MDAAIDHSGNFLYYTNAYFNSCLYGMPCEASLGVAQKQNDSTFNKLGNTAGIFSNVNDTNYIVYAPQLTHDGLELYYTRILKSTINSEICVSVRNAVTDTFSLPMVIHSNLGFVPEAASPTADKQKIYYHQKDGSGVFRMYLRYRTSTLGTHEPATEARMLVYPNPVQEVLQVKLPESFMADYTLRLYNVQGKELLSVHNTKSIDLSYLASGMYLLKLQQQGRQWLVKVMKN